jgi:hypothetical protein
MNVMQTRTNPYLTMPLDRVQADARHGVQLACQAWRARDAAGAARALGPVVEPGRDQKQAERQVRVRQAVKDFYRGQSNSRSSVTR